ncbi:MAG: hypothetical protein AAF591_01335 [Verrucomicrobiota bacterium]
MPHLIITTANTDQDYEIRKPQYLKSIDKAFECRHLFASVTILECTSKDEPYLGPYPVHYSKAPNSFPNKGLNEMTHLKTFLNRAPIPPDDFVIKLTGRYLLRDDSFLHLVRNAPASCNSIFKDDSDVYQGNGYHTFLFAMRKNALLKTIDNLDFDPGNNAPIEWHFKNFLQDQSSHRLVDSLGVTAFQGHKGEVVFDC